jgi:hypothetical protein
VLFATLVPIAAARAGGWTTLQLARRVYLPGERAVARARFNSRVDWGGSLEQGPYVAWLIVSGQTYSIIDPPRIPHTTIRLGALALALIDRRRANAQRRELPTARANETPARELARHR